MTRPFSFAESLFRVPLAAVLTVLAILSVSGPVSQSAYAASPSNVIQCDTFAYEFGPDGRNRAFIDKTDGKNYLKQVEGDAACAAWVVKGDKTSVPESVAFEKKDVLRFRFTCGATARVRVVNEKNRVMLTVLETTGDVDSFVFLNVPLTLEAIPTEPFAACALSQNLHTHVHALPALQRELKACCYKKFGIKDARVAVVGVPQKQILPTIREIMTQAAPTVPFSDQGGAWALQAKEGYGSYLMNFGSLTEETVDQWIEACRAIGFNQIDNHGGSPSFYLFGSFEMDRKRFPEGWKTYKKIIDKLHAAGISSILHSYACYISPTAKYVTPVPSDDLDTVASFTLAEPIDAAATEIVVKESTANVPLVMGYTETSNHTIKIGKEIVRYDGATKEAPFKFTGCKRGWHKTTASPHAAGSNAGILKTFWSGLYIARPDSALWEEVAKNHADVVNECGFDGIYFDAIEGIRWMWGEEDYWYYGSKFVFDVMKHMKKPVGVEYAGMMHHWWHYRSRYQAWDKPRRGYKRFMDIHIAAMKAGEEYQHGCWEGHLPRIEKFAGMKDCGLFLPLQLGWSDMHVWSGPLFEPTFSDDIEYVCCKMIGNNAGLSMTSGLDKARLEAFPAFLDYAKMIARYEKLRHEHYFDESICAKLRQPGKDFTLFRDTDGKWRFKPVFYKKHKVCGLDHESGLWTVRNEFDAQPIQLRLEVLMSCAAYNDPNGVTLLDCAKTDKTGKTVKTLTVSKSAEGVAFDVVPGETIPGIGDRAIALPGVNTGASRDASWACRGKTFEPALKLGDRQALGVWVKGDGKGEVVDFRVESHPVHYGKADFMVRADFVGWRYFELIEGESTALSEFVWPKTEKGYFVYTNYRNGVDFERLDGFQIWLNNLPKGEPTQCEIGPVRALPLKTIEIENPTIVVNRKRMTLPVKMSTGMYLEMLSDGNCKVYDKNSKLVQTVKPIGRIPVMNKGDNVVGFICDAKNDASTRVQVTVIGTGKAL